MEEKLNSIIITIVFIIGLLIPMDLINVHYLLMFLLFILFLVYKCRLLLIFDEKFRYTYIFLLIIVLLGILRGYIFSKDYISVLKFDGLYSGNAQILTVEKNKKHIVRLNNKPHCLVMLTTKEELKPGMIISLKGYLELPKSEANKGGFSYKDYLKYKGIKFTTKSNNIIILEQIKNLRYYLFEYQEYYIAKLQKKLGNQTRFIESIFLGNVSSLEETEVDTWRKMGILHLQAVSGSQVGAALDILLFLFVITPKKGLIKYIFFLTPLILYGLMTDTPSVWRVILFLIIIKIFQVFKIEKYEMLALMLSSVVLIIINPGIIFYISFQLSYVISIGLLLYSEKIKEIKKPIVKILLSGIISVILSWPILIFYFQEVSLMSIFFTPLISPLIQLIIFISGIFMFFPFFIDLIGLLTYFLKLILILLEQITLVFSNINLPVYIGKPWGLANIILFYLLYIFWNNQIFKKYYRKVLLGVFIVLLFYNTLLEFFDSKKVIVTFINVGQGDCILIECKEMGKVILIDGGAKNDYQDMGKREVIPYLKRKGIKKIDIMISTHGDNDYRGGLETILKKIPVSKIWIPNNREEDYKDWLKLYEKKIEIVHDEIKIYLGDIVIDIINPDNRDNNEDSNASSIVLSLEYGESSILLTGDCDLEILDSLAMDRLDYDIIKAPHHGSKNSYRTGIYSDLKAKSVIFSVGENKYGHPSKDIVAELEKNDIKYYRNDRDLDVVVTLKKYLIDINGRKLVD
ncbi:MAG: competence protein ComEC [Fusobacteria bacterium]|nr:MAG: competence protein ComEC [Fusobacteriota bacterium]KAF0230025.1 MAG: competence protein [Fusobacteriota bacterium]